MRLGRRSQVAAALVALLIAGCSQRAEQARLLLEDIQAVGGASTLASVSGPVERQTGSFDAARGVVAGDLYRPAAPRAGLVLVPGVSESGKDDPRLVALANSLARVQFLVLVPDIGNLRLLKVRPEDAAAIANATTALARRPELAPRAKIGVAAISYAVGPAMLAALEPEADRRIDFLLAVGGYYDLERLIGFFTTGTIRGARAFAPPHPWGKWVFAQSNLDLLPERDRDAFRVVVHRRMANEAAAIEDLRPRLGPQARAVLDLLENRDPARVPSLIAGLPESVRRSIAELDLARRDLSGIGARVILVHGRSDTVVPAIESESLAQALGPKAQLFLVEGMIHVEAEGLGFFDRLVLWDAAIQLLALRE
jgi:pimeloyl-ACP methyl ester carboxylesterase